MSILLGIDIVERASFARRRLSHDFNFLTELVNLKCVVFLISCVPAERILLLLLFVYLLESAALDLELKLVAEALNYAVYILHLEGVDEFSFWT